MTDDNTPETGEALHPTSAIPEANWSPVARLASSIWFGMDSANRWIFINKFGVTETARLEFEFLRKHQEAHFLDGSAKLGLLDHPDHVRCAMYHCLSNLLGGLDMGYQGDNGDGKAWVFYFAPQAYATGPLQPTSAHSAVPIEVVLRTFEAWHANNGPVLGNDRLFFTLTDLIQAGGPYDAGYFSEAPGPVPPDKRYVIRLGEERGIPGSPPALGPAEWPQGRRDGALRKYSAEYALGGLAQIAQFKGMDVAIDIAEHSHRDVFVAWARPLAAEWKIDRKASPERQVSWFFEQCFGLLGDTFTTIEDGRDVLLKHDRTRLRVPQYPGWEYPPADIERAFARAWAVISRSIGPEVLVHVEQSRSEGAEATVWRFRRSGR
ncbi:hypothetical protein ACFQU1_11830 [Chelatococcus sp. GCM10030263]|uniref:hypothetical protein n=1 Tax=Chelatococcus sp. GCM10030263 TaxID=3273387 RepID=UPI00361DDAC9